MKFFVTGGTGYIGSACVLKLLSLGHEVCASTRSKYLADEVSNFWLDSGYDLSKLSWVELDFLDINACSEAIKDVDVVMHVASPVPKSFRAGFSELVLPAVSGVRAVMQAVSGSNVKKVVMTSSIAAMCNGHDSHCIDFKNWTDLSKQISNYAFSKTYAELTAWQMQSLLPEMPELVTILPGFVFGKPVYPEKRSSSVGFVRKLLNMRFPYILPLGFHVVSLDDVVDLHIYAALNDNASGLRLPICSEKSLSLLEMSNWLSESGIASEKRLINLPKLLIPKFYKGFLVDERTIDISNSVSATGIRANCIKKDFISMAKFIKNYVD